MEDGFAFLRKSHGGCGAPPRVAFRIHPQIESEQPLMGSLVFWWRRMDSNHRRRSQQIYSLSPLATWVLLHIQLGGRRWSWWTDSNPRPADYKSAALPAELHQQVPTARFMLPDQSGFVNCFFIFFASTLWEHHNMPHRPDKRADRRVRPGR